MRKTYEGIKECYYRVSVKAILRDKKGRFALGLKKMKIHGKLQIKFDIPGGGIDHGEEPHEALQREIMEEMGLSLTKISEFPIYITISESACGNIPLLLIYYEAEVEDFNFTPSDECMEIKFVTVEEAQNMDLYHPNKKVMREIEKLEK